MTISASRAASILLPLALPLAAGCAGLAGGIANQGAMESAAISNAQARPERAREGARRIFPGSPAAVEAAIAAEWGKAPELAVRRENGALVAEQTQGGMRMTMTARLAPAGSPDRTEVELLIAPSTRLAPDRVQEMEFQHLDKLYDAARK